MGKQLCKRHG